MKIYALEGKSGTGKSFQAQNLCRDKNIVSIIDDGLFIYENEVMAGISAKREPTKIGAIKTALFTDEKHREAVVRKIKETDPQSILLIGTSEGMVERIRKRLGLPEISEMIHIEDITTEEERELAEKQRNTQGEHVVPAPTFQLKRQFSGYLMSPIRMIKGLGFGRDDDAEKSVVRPTYSYLGEYMISDRVMSDIVDYIVSTIPGAGNALRVITEKRHEGLKLTILIYMELGINVIEGAKKIQEKCVEAIEEMTSFNIEQVDVEIRGLI